MLAFMGAQSYLMMYMAGAGWQFGKRKISAKSNEEFNALDVTSLYKQMTTELKESIPTIERSMNDMTQMVAPIIEQYGDFIREAIAAIPQAAKNIAEPGSPIGKALAEPDAWAALVSFLNSITPGLPSAEARRGPGISQQATQIVTQQNTQAERLAKHKAFIEANRRKDITTPSRNIPRVHQIAIQHDRGTSVKRKAGQTQIQARLKLIREIDSLTKLHVYEFNRKSVSVGALSRSVNYRAKRKLKQIELTGLLERYRF